MRITADTNVLIRAVVCDDPEQSKIAADILEKAEKIVITIPALCEFVWVLSRTYKFPSPATAAAIRRLMEAVTIEIDRPSAEAGLHVLESGGDFADGVIAFEGRRMGGDVFASFDRDAVVKIRAAGGQAIGLSKL